MASVRTRIDGVKLKPLRVLPDERGWLMEVLRADEPELFTKFGQVYVSATYPGVVKAWHYHKVQTDHICAIQGMIKLVLYDPREDSPTRGEINEFFIGEHAPLLIEIPNLVYHGFKCVSATEAMVINFTTECYNYKDPDEYRLEPHGGQIPYDWARKDG